MPIRYCDHERLRDFCQEILVTQGLPADDAFTVADSLVHANLRGVDSHGVTRMPIYVERLRRGIVTAEPDIQVSEPRPGVVVVDGDNGMGQVVSLRALDLGLARLNDVGNVAVAVRRTTHYGAGAYYVERAVAQGAIIFAYSNAPPTMAPWGGVDPYIGTNPYAFGAPAGRHEPVVLDMATSVVARGKIITAASRGEAIPEGWALDAEGHATTDAEEALRGSVLPFGGPKGYGIAVMVDIMAGVLSGSGFGSRIGDLYNDLSKPQDVGGFFSLMNVAAFMDPAAFKQRMDTLIDDIKAIRRAPGVEEILLPGEQEAQALRSRQESGIPLKEGPWRDLSNLGKECGIEIEKTLAAS